MQHFGANGECHYALRYHSHLVLVGTEPEDTVAFVYLILSACTIELMVLDAPKSGYCENKDLDSKHHDDVYCDADK